METKNLKSSENEVKQSSKITENTQNEVVEKKSENAADIILKKLAEKRKTSGESQEAKPETKKAEKKEELKELKELSKELETISEVKKAEPKKEEKKEEVIEEKSEKKEVTETLKPEPKEEIDYNPFDKKELIEKLENLLDQPVTEIKDDVEKIKSVFYRKHKEENAQKRQEFIEAGNDPKEFKLEPNEDEQKFKETYKKYQDLKAEHNAKIEQHKKDNLNKKLEIITQIENLVNKQETLNNTFEEFKELQQKWKEIGIVPPEDVKELWSKYNFAVEKFYDYVKINKELRDLDFKKNLEVKIELCEKAEKLVLAEKVVKAFQDLQILHAKWKETGPVPKENRDEIWERFKEATSKINKRHHDYFEEMKSEQENNLKAKTLICEKIDELLNTEMVSHRDWQESTNEVLELQKIWRLIGFAPKKENAEIYQRFRTLCDNFFDKKREYYDTYNEKLEENLQKKTELCIQAESLKESTEWKKTTAVIIDLQKQWKTIGHVPKKDFEELNKRFRSACNYFFDQKKAFFQDRIDRENENLVKKQELIEKVKQVNTDEEGSFEALQALQKEWSQIGFVPFKEKDTIYKAYQTAVDEKFSKFKAGSRRRNEAYFKNKLENLAKAPNAKYKINSEIDKLRNALAKVNDEVILLENNIGFFAKSKNAESMIADFNKKIDKAKQDAKEIKAKIVELEKTSKKVETEK